MEDRNPHARGLRRDVLTARASLYMVLRLGFGTEAQNLKPMRQRRKAVLPADLVAQLLELVAVEFDHFSRGYANQVIVDLSASNYLVVGLLVVEEYLFENSRILEVGKRAIDGGAGDAVGQLLQLRDQLVGLEQAVVAEGGVEDHGPLGGEFKLVIVQISAEDGADGFVGQDLALGFGRKFLFLDAGKEMGPLGHHG